MSEQLDLSPMDGDTSLEALRVQTAALRAIPPARRLELMNDLTVMTQQLAREGLRQRHPDATSEQLEDLYAELTLGPELTAQVRDYREKLKQGAAVSGSTDLLDRARREAERRG